MAASRQPCVRRTGAAVYYCFCATMMGLTLGHIQCPADTPFPLEVLSAIGNNVGFIQSAVSVFTNARGAHPLQLRVWDAVWIYVGFPWAYLMNHLVMPRDIDHLAVGAVLTFASVFLELPLTVTLLGCLVSTCPTFLYIEWSARQWKHFKAGSAAHLQDSMQQLCVSQQGVPGDSLHTCAISSATAANPPTLAGFLPRAVLVVAVLLALNLTSQVLLHAQTVLDLQHRRHKAAASQGPSRGSIGDCTGAANPDSTAEGPTRTDMAANSFTTAQGPSSAPASQVLNRSDTVTWSLASLVHALSSGLGASKRALSMPAATTAKEGPKDPAPARSHMFHAASRHPKVTMRRLWPDWQALEDRWSDVIDQRTELECRMYQGLLSKAAVRGVGMSLVFVVCVPMVLYTITRAFMGLLYTRDRTPEEYLFSPSWVLLSGVSCVVLARVNVWTILQSLLTQQHKSREMEGKLRDLQNTHAALLEERRALQAQLLANYAPRSTIDTGTPADKLRTLLHELITGNSPQLPLDQLHDLHAALLHGWDVYQPMNLAARITASALDEDVGAALASTLGAGSMRLRSNPPLHSLSVVYRTERTASSSTPGILHGPLLSPARTSAGSHLHELGRESLGQVPNDIVPLPGQTDTDVTDPASRGHSFTRMQSPLHPLDETAAVSQGDPDLAAVEAVEDDELDTLADLRGISSSHPGMRSVLGHIVSGEVRVLDPHSPGPAPQSGTTPSIPESGVGGDAQHQHSARSRFCSSCGGSEPSVAGSAPHASTYAAARDLRTTMSDACVRRGSGCQSPPPLPRTAPRMQDVTSPPGTLDDTLATAHGTPPAAATAQPAASPGVAPAGGLRDRIPRLVLTLPRSAADMLLPTGSNSSSSAGSVMWSAIHDRARATVALSLSTARARHSFGGSPRNATDSAAMLDRPHSGLRPSNTSLPHHTASAAAPADPFVTDADPTARSLAHGNACGPHPAGLVAHCTQQPEALSDAPGAPAAASNTEAGAHLPSVTGVGSNAAVDINGQEAPGTLGADMQGSSAQPAAAATDWLDADAQPAATNPWAAVDTDKLGSASLRTLLEVQQECGSGSGERVSPPSASGSAARLSRPDRATNTAALLAQEQSQSRSLMNVTAQLMGPSSQGAAPVKLVGMPGENADGLPLSQHTASGGIAGPLKVQLSASIPYVSPDLHLSSTASDMAADLIPIDLQAATTEDSQAAVAFSAIPEAAAAGPAGQAASTAAAGPHDGTLAQAADGGVQGSEAGVQGPVPESPLLDDVERILADVDSWNLNIFKLSEASQGHPLSTLSFFLMARTGLVKEFNLDAWSLARFLSHIESGYLDNPYHNKVHAAHVLHRLHVLLHRGGFMGGYADHLTLMGCYMAAAIHDFEHLGITNDFLITTQDPLAILYNDKAPLENHHLAASFALLRQPGFNFLSHLARQDFDRLRKLVIELVLGTDMKLHFSLLSQFNAVHVASSVSRRTAALPAATGTHSHLHRTTSSRLVARDTTTSTTQDTGASKLSSTPSPAIPILANRRARLVTHSLSERVLGRRDGLGSPGAVSLAGSPSPIATSAPGPTATHATAHPRQASHPNARPTSRLFTLSNLSLTRMRDSGDADRRTLDTEQDTLDVDVSAGLRRSAYSATLDTSPLLTTHAGSSGGSPSVSTRPSVGQQGLSGQEEPAHDDTPISGVAGGTGTVFGGSGSRSCGTSAAGSAGGSLGAVLVGSAPAEALTPIDENERMLSLQIALKSSDICNLCDPLDTHLVWVFMLEEEFFRQGDIERDLCLPISPLFDRTKPGVSKSQVAFMDIVAVPLFTALTSAFPGAEPLLKGLMSNYHHWVAEKEKADAAAAAATAALEAEEPEVTLADDNPSSSPPEEAGAALVAGEAQPAECAASD